jgi:hypothetical protein
MVMVAAGRVEEGLAMGAAVVGLKVGGNGERGVAEAAKNRMVLPLRLRPNSDGMIGESDMAILTSVKEAAAFHLDGDDVRGTVIVKAAGLRVEVEAVNCGDGLGH